MDRTQKFLKDLVEAHGARDATARQTALAELGSASLKVRQHITGASGEVVLFEGLLACTGRGGKPDWTGAVRGMEASSHTPGAVAVLFELAALVHKASSVEQAQRAAGQLKGLGAVLGVLQQEAQVFMRSGVRLSETEIDAQIAERARAKRERDFKRADDIRAALLAQGIELKDGPQGTTWVRA